VLLFMRSFPTVLYVRSMYGPGIVTAATFTYVPIVNRFKSVAVSGSWNASVRLERWLVVIAGDVANGGYLGRCRVQVSCVHEIHHAEFAVAALGERVRWGHRVIRRP
jgi:hypothetical protein